MAASAATDYLPGLRPEPEEPDVAAAAVDEQ